MTSLSTANNHFGLDLLNELKKNHGKQNIFLSPFSISTVSGMLYLGARGNSAAQIEKALHFDEAIRGARSEASKEGPYDKQGGIHGQFQKLLKEVNKSGQDYALNIANKMYGEKTESFLEEYINTTKKLYQAGLEPVDFINDVEGSRKEINSWVEKQTQEKIKDLFPSGSLNQNSKLVLVNAIYFKGKWNREFPKANTHKEAFSVDQNTSKQVQMMQLQEFFNWASIEEVQAEILEIPYKNKELSMIVLLPREINGLEKLEQGLSPEKLKAWTSSSYLRRTEVDLLFPRLQMREKYNLKSTLQAMGVTDVFNEGTADLSGMAARKPLSVSQFLHQSFVEVNEEGTEAAAATGVVVSTLSASIPRRFHCDHPFIFFIRHNATGSILFLGRVVSP
ncbi:serpin B4 [Ornithorhynchus anatinus]|uniref:Serpin domain-containing protein n=1 Tax=Ornithorhynchus anatinus TaxID=9258 RepID=A0A6I8NUU3_ORNAN|nr:serpin B4 [Ornithorhynchus anatinus]